MRTLRKTKRCLNCSRTLEEIYNFCPHCGQENNDQNVSFGTFIQEFFSNYFAFMLYGLLLAGLVIFHFSDNVLSWLSILAFIGLTLYALISFWRIYRQGWLKTLVKLFLLAFVYSNILLVFGLSEILVSFMIF